DPGAVNATHGTEEADRVLFTSLELRNYLQEDSEDASGGGNWEVRLSRTTDTFISLSARSADANFWGADRFLSIHQNAFNRSANGTETFSLSDSGSGARFRNLVQAEAIEAWGLTNRGNKTASFSVLRNTAMPAALTEMGFIDSPVDHEFCSSDQECKKFAKHMMFALQRHYELDEYLPGGTPSTEIIVDNTNSSTYSESGFWSTSTSPGFWQADSRYASAYGPSPHNQATFRPNLQQAGQYEVYAWWVKGGNRSPGAAYVISDLTGPTTVKVDQRTDGKKWNLLGTFNFESGTDGNVVLSAKQSAVGTVNPASVVVIADAVRFVRVGDLDINEVIVDNTDAGFSASARDWFTGDYTSGFLGPNYHARPTEYTSDPASWSVGLPVAGRWEVFARWTTGSNRTRSAPFFVKHDGGTSTRYANQRSNNGQWYSLGTYEFSTGYSTKVQLSCWTDPGAFVIADAIRFVKR
ncbi:MAG: N-acetylmuramoyl-L-alanine amidase, partial [Verrucomicrobiota bacterium]